MEAMRKLGRMWRSFHNLCSKLLAGSAYRFSELPQPVCARIPVAVKAALLLTHTRRHVPVPDNSDPVLHHSAAPPISAICWLTILRPTMTTRTRTTIGGLDSSNLQEESKTQKKHQSIKAGWKCLTTFHWSLQGKTKH